MTPRQAPWSHSPITGRVVLGAAAGRTTMAETVERIDVYRAQLRAELLATMRAFAVEEAARSARRWAHAERMARTARYLGRQLARHDITRAQVERRLDALVYALDPAAAPLVEVHLLEVDTGQRIVEAALALGLEEESHGR